MKRTWFVILALAVLIGALGCGGALASDPDHSLGADVYYMIGTNRIWISGSGPTKDYEDSASPLQGQTLGTVRVAHGVSYLGNNVLYGCHSLTCAEFMDPGTVISDMAFSCCDRLTVIRGWAGSTAEAYALEWDFAFEPFPQSGSCGSQLSYSFYPVTGRLTISGTGAMAELDYNDSPWAAFREAILSVNIRSGVTSVAANAFQECVYLSWVSLPEGLTAIGGYAFEDTALSSVYIPSTVTTIGEQAFCLCTELCGIDLPFSVTRVGAGAFAYTDLQSAYVRNPDCVLGDSMYNVFSECGEGFTLYGYSRTTAEAYAANPVDPCRFELLLPAPELILPADLAAVGEEAFRGVNAQAALIPKTVTDIAGNAFDESNVRYIYGFRGTAAQALVLSRPGRFLFIPMTDAWYDRLTN